MTAEAGGGAVRRRVVYHGHVQGVLFRATARELAGEHDVVGYVRNRPDGSVELEAEGPPPDVDGFLAAVVQHFRGYIRRTELTDLPPRGDEMRFEVRY